MTRVVVSVNPWAIYWNNREVWSVKRCRYDHEYSGRQCRECRRLDSGRLRARRALEQFDWQAHFARRRDAGRLDNETCTTVDQAPCETRSSVIITQPQPKSKEALHEER